MCERQAKLARAGPDCYRSVWFVMAGFISRRDKLETDKYDAHNGSVEQRFILHDWEKGDGETVRPGDVMLSFGLGRSRSDLQASYKITKSRRCFTDSPCLCAHGLYSDSKS